MPDDDGSQLKTSDSAPLRVTRYRRPKFKIADVATALQKSAGVMAGAADILAEAYGRCDRNTVRAYRDRYPQLRQVIDEAVEHTLDVAETKLIAAINKDHDWAIKFLLETKGKHRGYTRRQEITGAGGRPIEESDARDRFLAQLVEIGERLVGHLTAGGAGDPGDPRPNGADKTPAIPAK
jgi:hypothetical protein